jgi:hypothetical protein
MSCSAARRAAARYFSMGSDVAITASKDLRSQPDIQSAPGYFCPDAGVGNGCGRNCPSPKTKRASIDREVRDRARDAGERSIPRLGVPVPPSPTISGWTSSVSTVIAAGARVASRDTSAAESGWAGNEFVFRASAGLCVLNTLTKPTIANPTKTTPYTVRMQRFQPIACQAITGQPSGTAWTS